jgi:tetratricopeptide (TPR) repeat protein
VIRAAADPWFWLPLAIGATGVVGAVASIRRAPLLAIAAAVFIAPYSIISNSAFLIGTMLAERLFYLPSIGICWAIGFALAALFDRASPNAGRFHGSVRTLAIAAIPIALLGSMSFKRAQDWQNEELLYHQALQTYPRNTGMWLTLGEIAIRTGRYPLAIERMGRVIEIVPDFTKAWLDRGTLLAALGQNQAAAADLRRALELNPDDLLALENLAVVERQLGHHAEAGIAEKRAAGVRSRHDATLRPKAGD